MVQAPYIKPHMKKYSRGLRGAPAKDIGRVYRREGSNPSFFAIGWMAELGLMHLT